MNPNTGPGIFIFSEVGSNTLVQISDDPFVLYNLSIEQFGGSAGFLQLYNNGTQATSAGVAPAMVYAVGAGTFTAGTPAIRDLVFPNGIGFGSGLSYLWAAGPTGTVAHGVNARVNIIGKSL